MNNLENLLAVLKWLAPYLIGGYIFLGLTALMERADRKKAQVKKTVKTVNNTWAQVKKALEEEV